MKPNSSFVPIPIIRLDIQNMQRTMAYALSEYAAELDSTLQAALEAYCTPGNLERVIQSEVTKVLDQVIKEEVKNWFVYGEGRKTIKKAVEEKLRDNETYTPLDYE
jgi:hypothetical protein